MSSAVVEYDFSRKNCIFLKMYYIYYEIFERKTTLYIRVHKRYVFLLKNTCRYEYTNLGTNISFEDQCTDPYFVFRHNHQYVFDFFKCRSGNVPGRDIVLRSTQVVRLIFFRPIFRIFCSFVPKPCGTSTKRQCLEFTEKNS